MKYCLFSHRHAFSLVEVTLALAIASFTLAGILGMLPAASKTARESIHDSRATLIAQTVFNNLQTTPFDAAQPFDMFTQESEVIKLGENTSRYFSLDENGIPIGVLAKSEFENGVKNNAGFILLVESHPQSTDLSQVIVNIQTPAFAEEKNRDKRPFTTLIKR